MTYVVAKGKAKEDHGWVKFTLVVRIPANRIIHRKI
jgi:hypothetical protein